MQGIGLIETVNRDGKMDIANPAAVYPATRHHDVR